MHSVHVKVTRGDEAYEITRTKVNGFTEEEISRLANLFQEGVAEDIAQREQLSRMYAVLASVRMRLMALSRSGSITLQNDVDEIDSLAGTVDNLIGDVIKLSGKAKK